MKLQDCTLGQVQDYLKEGPGGLIIPIGTCEQHGYHLPLGADTLVAERLAEACSARTGLLIAPTLSYGVNLPLDRTMAGTASLTQELLHGQLEALLSWWRSQGFQFFILLTCHGDPFHLMALDGLGADTLYVEPEGDLELGGVLDTQVCIRHACEGETSLALYLFPERVRLSWARTHDIPYKDFRPYLFHEASGQPEGYVGSLGHPEAATAQKGQIIWTRMVERLLAQYQAFRRSL